MFKYGLDYDFTHNDEEKSILITGNLPQDSYIHARFKYLENYMKSMSEFINCKYKDEELMNDRLYNIESHIQSVEIDLEEYANDNPKSSDQYVEERLRALEAQIKGLLETEKMRWSEGIDKLKGKKR